MTCPPPLLIIPLFFIHSNPGRPTARPDPNSIHIQTDCPPPRLALGPGYKRQQKHSQRAEAVSSGEAAARAPGVHATTFDATKSASSIAQ